MLSKRHLTLVGSNIIFLAGSAALLLFPGWELGLYPAYSLIFVLNDYSREEEVHVIFAFLCTIAAFLLMMRSPETAVRLGLVVETAGIWALIMGLGLHRGRLALQESRILREVDRFDAKIRDDDRELRYYNTFEGSAVAQIRLRRDLTQAAKSLGTTMDAHEVQVRLLRVLEGRYKSSRIQILPGSPQDPLVGWAVRTRTPVLVRDMRKEDRFGPSSDRQAFRSALVVPLSVHKEPYGFLYLTDEQPEAFGSDDLRTVDLLATLASLTLDNIQLYQEVHQLAIHDALTQLFTQRAFLDRLKEELLRAGRSQMPVSLLMADIDHFKKYNDTYGHQAGDELLRTVSRLLMKHVRPVDCVARYGGEEFCVILPNTVHDQAVALAQRIRQAVADEPFVFKGKRTQVTMSLGVSSFPKDATSQSQLIRSADERLYRSKDGGRNQVTG